MKNVYVDCTNTFALEYTTGIQRVVKNIVMRLEEDEAENFQYIPILNIENKNYAVDVRRLAEAKWTRRIQRVATLARNSLNTVLPEVEFDDSQKVNPLNCVKIRNSVKDLLIRIAQKFMFKLFKAAYLADGLINLKGYVELGPGKILFVADSFWKDPICDLIVNANKTGCTTIVLIYDIIAITHPSTFNRQFRDNFSDKLKYLAGSIDGVMTISEYSMTEIMKYMDDINPKLECDYFYLGADFTDLPKDGEPDNKQLLDVFEGNSVYLMVGTVEPRKNHEYVLDAFEKIWEAGGDAHLCIVGRKGWLCAEVINHILSSPQYDCRLTYFSDLDDRGLTYCYRHAKGQVIASVVEGFGLPLVEAMNYGKPVFASDIPVFREVGGDYPEYFNLADSQSLADAVSTFEQNGGEVEHQSQSWLSWDESVEGLLRKIESMNERLSMQESKHV